MNINVGDRVQVRKPHPCGNYEFDILRIGMDFKMRCTKCGREFMVQRSKIEKNIKAVISVTGED